MENTIVIEDFTLSGYGDRMIDLLCWASYAKLKNKKLYIRWQDYPGMSDYTDIPTWRFEDTRLTNFLSFFRLPEHVTLSYDILRNPLHVKKQYLGGTTSPQCFYDKFISKSIPRETWDTTVYETMTEFGFKIPKYVHEQPYAVVHLRRTDKLRGNVCSTMIDVKELDTLNSETKKAILVAKENGITHFYIATDYPPARDEYETFLLENGCVVIHPENIHTLLPSYYDTWIMRSSSLIIVSMRYSTFSLFPSLLWKVPLWTVLNDRFYENLLFDKHAPITYYKNLQLGN